MYRFEKLEVWQKAMNFCELVYRKSKDFPKSETFGLSSQIRRATTSIPLNIAEGSACKTDKEFIQFLFIALRSHYEVVTIVKLISRLKFLPEVDCNLLEKDLAEIGRLLQGLINSLQKRSNNQQPKTND